MNDNSGQNFPVFYRSDSRAYQFYWSIRGGERTFYRYYWLETDYQNLLNKRKRPE